MEKAAGMLPFLNAIFVWFQKHDFTKITGPNDWRIVVSINNARLPLEIAGPNGLLHTIHQVIYRLYTSLQGMQILWDYIIIGLHMEGNKSMIYCLHVRINSLIDGLVLFFLNRIDIWLSCFMTHGVYVWKRYCWLTRSISDAVNSVYFLNGWPSRWCQTETEVCIPRKAVSPRALRMERLCKGIG